LLDCFATAAEDVVVRNAIILLSFVEFAIFIKLPMMKEELLDCYTTWKTKGCSNGTELMA